MISSALETPATSAALSTLKEDFARDGFAVFPSLLTPAEVEEIKAEFNEIHRTQREKAWDDGVRDPSDPLFQYPRIVHPHRFNALARHYMLHPRVRECLRHLFGEDPVATQSMFYFKPPGARGQAMHQDNMYLLVDPGTCMAAWTAIDKADRDNGGMILVPGTHRGNILCQEAGDTTASFTGTVTRIPDRMKPLHVPLEAGDTLFFGGSVIHGSGPNRSTDRFRRAFIGHYAAGSLEKISKFYLPLVKMDGADFEVQPNPGGGACGETWQGGLH